MEFFETYGIYNCSFEDALPKLINFWVQYRECYPEYKKNFLDKAIFHEFKYIENVPDVLLEIYVYLGIIKQEYNNYGKLIDFYENYFKEPYDKEIVEIGTGSLPILALNLQKTINFNKGNGHVLGYDPELAVTFPEIKLKKELFTAKTNISNIDLLMGFFPCEATEVMIDKALNEQKELCLQLCSCVPEIYHNEITSTEWLNLLNKKISGNISSGYTYEFIDAGVTPNSTLALKKK